jgi:arylsulfatase A-like enzyme
MLTGRNHTTVGMACIAEATTGFPGSNGHIPFETATIAEVLGEKGYNTYMLGKWHCVAEDETNMASSKRNWPTGRGFERYYGFLGGETNQYYPDLVQDQQFVDQPYGPEDGYHLSKRDTWEGGVCDPLIVHWPRGIKAQGELRDQYNHCIDIVPTVYECLGIELPQEVKGYTQWRLEGTSFRYSFDDATATTQKPSQFYVMLGTRALWRDGWKVDAIHAGAPSDWGHFAQDKWALYHTETDRSEVHDVGDQHPELRDELVDLWLFQAGQYFGLPLEDRDAISVLTTPRPSISQQRDRYVYYPGTLEVPEAVAVNIRGRSFKIAADVDLQSPEAGGVVFAHGHHFGGHNLGCT